MRVMLADDALLFREGLARLMGEAGFEVTGQCGDAERLLILARSHRPDVAVVDIRMPPTYTSEGLDAARRLRAEHPGLGVLLLSQYVETHHAMTLVRDACAATGGAGYLLKDRVTRLSELAEAVRRVAAGECVVDPGLVSRLVSRPRSSTVLEELTGRESQVLALMAEGRSNSAIARNMGLSHKTVEAYVRNVFDRLGLALSEDDNRRVLAVLAYLRAS
nr:response regulator transcription factor [Nonomuraea jiangxiensis]